MCLSNAERSVSSRTAKRPSSCPRTRNSWRRSATWWACTWTRRATHDYIRAGTTDLFAALEVATGKVITQTRHQHRAIEFRSFLNTINRNVPADLNIHLICDNLSTHKAPEIKRWLLRHPRFVIHFTPTGSSWLNLVERWFAEITVKLIRRGVHRSVKDLERDITT